MDETRVFVYQSLLLAEWGLMRHKNPLLQVGITSDGTLIIGAASSLGFGHDASRAMSVDIMVFAVLRGLIWASGGHPFTANKPRRVNLKTLVMTARKVLEEGVEGGTLGDIVYAILREFIEKGLLLPVVRNKQIGYPECPDINIDPSRDPLTSQALASGILRELNSRLTEDSKLTPGSFKDIVGRVRSKFMREIGGLPSDSIDICFKTLHGEIARLAEVAKSLPDRYSVTGVHLLPVLVELRNPPASGDGVLLPGEVRGYLRSACPGMGVSLADALETALYRAGYRGLNLYQLKWLSKYFDGKELLARRDGLLTAPTGAGKTLAFMIAALVEVLASRCRGESRPVVLVYPRKTLEKEQLETLLRIVDAFNREIQRRGLKLRPVTILVRDGHSPTVPGAPSGARAKREVMPQCPNRSPLRGITLQGGRQATHCVEAGGGGLIYRSDPPWIMDIYPPNMSIRANNTGQHPYEAADIIVTNYSMVLKSLMDDASERSKGSEKMLASRITHSILLVMDEAHLYMGMEASALPQLISILLQKLSGERPSIIVSSATLAGGRFRELLGKTDTVNILAFAPARDPVQDAHSIFKTATSLDPVGLVYVDYYSITARSSSSMETPPRLRLWVLVRPSLLLKPQTAFLEFLVNLLHVTAALRGTGGVGDAKSLAFVEYKRSLVTSAENFVRRQILESGDVYDKVLLTDIFPNPLRANRSMAQKAILDVLKNAQGTLLEVLADEGGVTPPFRPYFNQYHTLYPYLSLGAIREFRRFRFHTSNRSHSDVIERWVRRRSRWLGGTSNSWLERLLDQAEALMHHRPFAGDYHGYLSNYSGAHLVLVHHGDVEPRLRVDELLASGWQGATPLLIMATSTLEVGLNIPGIIATVHYILPGSAGRVIQESGRAGRDLETLLTSMGIAVLRPNAWETPKLIEREAILYFLIPEDPIASIATQDPVALARLCLTLAQRDLSAGGAQLGSTCDDLGDALHLNNSALDVARNITTDVGEEISEVNKALASIASIHRSRDLQLADRLADIGRDLGKTVREAAPITQHEHNIYNKCRVGSVTLFDVYGELKTTIDDLLVHRAIDEELASLRLANLLAYMRRNYRRNNYCDQYFLNLIDAIRKAIALLKLHTLARLERETLKPQNASLDWSELPILVAILTSPGLWDPINARRLRKIPGVQDFSLGSFIEIPRGLLRVGWGCR
jgi:hypothetical protein